jgi:hypothetical protein
MAQLSMRPHPTSTRSRVALELDRPKLRLIQVVNGTGHPYDAGEEEFGDRLAASDGETSEPARHGRDKRRVKFRDAQHA